MYIYLKYISEWITLVVCVRTERCKEDEIVMEDKDRDLLMKAILEGNYLTIDDLPEARERYLGAIVRKEVKREVRLEIVRTLRRLNVELELIDCGSLPIYGEDELDKIEEGLYSFTDTTYVDTSRLFRETHNAIEMALVQFSSMKALDKDIEIEITNLSASEYEVGLTRKSEKYKQECWVFDFTRGTLKVINYLNGFMEKVEDYAISDSEEDKHLIISSSLGDNLLVDLNTVFIAGRL